MLSKTTHWKPQLEGQRFVGGNKPDQRKHSTWGGLNHPTHNAISPLHACFLSPVCSSGFAHLCYKRRAFCLAPIRSACPINKTRWNLYEVKTSLYPRQSVQVEPSPNSQSVFQGPAAEDCAAGAKVSTDGRGRDNASACFQHNTGCIHMLFRFCFYYEAKLILSENQPKIINC